MIVIITGAPGSGKTKTAQYLLENTDKSALIDGDWLLAINPEDKSDFGRRLRYRNITSIARNYHESGFTSIYITFVYISDDNLQEQIEQLKNIDNVKIFALTPSDETLKERHDNDSYKREGIESSININNKIKELSVDEVIDNSNMTVGEVAEIISKQLEL